MFRAGQQIGLYTLVKRLGRGGFGEVWLADRSSKFVTTRVALKLPLDENVDVEVIKREAVLWERKAILCRSTFCLRFIMHIRKRL